MNNPIHVFNSLREMYRRYLDSPFDLRYPDLVKERDQLLDVDGRIHREPLIEPVPLQDVPRIQANPELKMLQGPELRTIFLGMDQKRDELLYSNVKGKNPFKDKRVRQAFYQAIDIDLIKRVKLERPRLRVLVLSMHGEQQYAARALKAGASGYLTKQSAPELLVTAIRQVAGGKKYVSPSLAEELANAITEDSERPPHEKLSDREYQTLVMIASGKNLTQIAEELKLSVKTVSVYRARLLDKMKLKNNAELTHYGLKHGLVE